MQILYLIHTLIHYLRSMKTFIALIFGLLTSSIWAQNPYFKAYSSGNFSACISLAESRMNVDSAKAVDHFYHAAAMMRLGELSQAERSFQKANEQGFQNRTYYFYHRAMLAASQVNPSSAVAWLDSVLNSSSPTNYLIEDSLFTPLKEVPEFQNKKEQIRLKVYECESNPNHAKLDFWIGNWDVIVGGVKRAESEISRPKGSCMLYENYSTLGDFKGQSFNFYDQALEAYHQIWIDYQAKRTDYYEVEAKEGYLLMETDSSSSPRLRMSYTLIEDGNVRQVMEQFDSSKSKWNSIFNGLYRRR